MTNPVPNYKISTPYKRKGELWKLGYHTGVDFKAPTGTPVVAAQAGRVLEVSQRVSWGESYGSAIVVMHKDMSRGIAQVATYTLRSDQVITKTGQGTSMAMTSTQHFTWLMMK
jgi:murein DD-endopeptidase MepM/ murein hydrolase activator NlpD